MAIKTKELQYPSEKDLIEIAWLLISHPGTMFDLEEFPFSPGQIFLQHGNVLQTILCHEGNTGVLLYNRRNNLIGIIPQEILEDFLKIHQRDIF